MSENEIAQTLTRALHHLKRLKSANQFCWTVRDGVPIESYTCAEVEFELHQYPLGNNPEGIKLSRFVNGKPFGSVVIAGLSYGLLGNGMITYRLQSEDNTRLLFGDEVPKEDVSRAKRKLNIQAFQDSPYTEVAIDIAINAGHFIDEDRIEVGDSRELVRAIKGLAVDFETWWQQNEPEKRDYLSAVDAVTEMVMIYRYYKESRDLAQTNTLDSVSVIIKLLGTVGYAAIATENTRLLDNVRSILNSTDVAFEEWHVVKDAVCIVTDSNLLAKEESE